MPSWKLLEYAVTVLRLPREGRVSSVLRMGNTLISDVGDVIARDPEVRQARMIADIARTRLVECVSGPDDVIDLAQARRMLEVLGTARTHAADAEDRVLVHRGLLTSGEAARRAACRRPTRSADDQPPAPDQARVPVRMGRVALGALAAVTLGVAGAALARWRGVRPPRSR